MNAQNNNIVNFAPDSKGASDIKSSVRIEQVKQDFVAGFMGRFELPRWLFQVALNEADALARQTEYPQLFFPSLAEEKIAAISSWYDRVGTAHGNYAVAV